jgi:hypothetical protein
MPSRFCQCEEPFRDPNDDEAWCWRCRRPIEAIDREGSRLGFAEDEEPPA